MILGSIIGGFGQGWLWTAQGEYVSLCAKEETKGFYFGFFWAIYMSSQITGNGIGGYMITSTSGPNFFLAMFGIMTSAVIGFFFVKLPPSQAQVELASMKYTEEKIQAETGKTEEKATGMIADMKSTLALIGTRKMMYLNP